MRTCRRAATIVAALLVPLSLLACAADDDGEPVTGSLPACDWAEVTNIVDGDTIDVELDGEVERVRYIGIDTPELRGSEPFSREAREANRRLVEGEDVCMERDVSQRDSFGRLLRYVYLRDGRMINEQLVRMGLAFVAVFPPDVKHIDPILRPAQRLAQEEQLGIWEGYEPEPEITPTLPACYVEGEDRCNCGDFDSQPQAQAFHDAFDPKDVNRLDANNDGVVCESLR